MKRRLTELEWAKLEAARLNAGEKAKRKKKRLPLPLAEVQRNGNTDDTSTPTACASTFSFVGPALLLAVGLFVGISYAYCRDAFAKAEAYAKYNYMTVKDQHDWGSLLTTYRPLSEMTGIGDASSEISKISADIENGRWKKADKELHQLRVVLQGGHRVSN